MNYRLAARAMHEKLMAHTNMTVIKAQQHESGTSRGHVLWMLEQVMNQDMSEGKANRWLGWAQALLKVWGFTSLAELKELNRACSCDDEGCPQYGTVHLHEQSVMPIKILVGETLREKPPGTYDVVLRESSPGILTAELVEPTHRVKLEHREGPHPNTYTPQVAWERFPDGKLKPFLDPERYDELRDDDRFLYNRGPKPEGLV